MASQPCRQPAASYCQGRRRRLIKGYVMPAILPARQPASHPPRNVCGLSSLCLLQSSIRTLPPPRLAMTHLHRFPPSTTARRRLSTPQHPRPARPASPAVPAMPKSINNPLPHPPHSTTPAPWDTRTNDGGLVSSPDPPKVIFTLRRIVFVHSPATSRLHTPGLRGSQAAGPHLPGALRAMCVMPRSPAVWLPVCHYPLITRAAARLHRPSSPGVHWLATAIQCPPPFCDLL
ncbi:hypothetical protein EDB81DRAFT_437403 [Dactylonectria macrodidyma]|uniref:Uncharacterized protein n=1 Tax=Dactylonectria macrodidyma TaxID=307937 RepID=A0A9P9F596_9HYPO|nr:hypothetical protein EDB81DRAFT_437403 [Dactylonectria macrodidyma]